MRTKLLSVLSAIIISFVTVSCNSSDDNQPGTVTFPENQTLTLAAGATQQIDLTGPGEFSLTCEKTWIRFVSGDPQVERETVYGSFGTNSFKVLVKDTGLDFADQTATITMKIGKEEKTIYTITRPGMVRAGKILLFDATTPNPGVDQPLEVDKVDFKYVDKYKYYFSFTANFKWKLKSQPDWIEVITKNTVGEAGEKVVITKNMNSPSFVTSKLPFAQTGEFVIEDVSDATKTLTFPVTFDGMTDDVVDFTPLNLRQGISVSDMGKFTNSNGEIESTKSIITSTRNMFTKVVHISFNAANSTPSEITGTNRWVTCTENPAAKGEFTLTVAENKTTVERTMYLYFLPEKYKTDTYPFTEDFPNNFFQSEYGVKITQQGKPLPDVFTFSFKNELGVDPTVVSAAVPYPDAALAAEFGLTADKIYRKVFKSSEWVEGKSLIIKANGKPGVGGAIVLENPGDKISSAASMGDEATKSFTFNKVKPYSEISRTLVYFWGSDEYIVILDKE